jgi:hypothetical protein
MQRLYFRVLFTAALVQTRLASNLVAGATLMQKITSLDQVTIRVGNYQGAGL